MNDFNRDLCRIRTITTFLVLDKDRAIWEEAIGKATRFCNDLCNCAVLAVP